MKQLINPKLFAINKIEMLIIKQTKRILLTHLGEGDTECRIVYVIQLFKKIKLV